MKTRLTLLALLLTVFNIAAQEDCAIKLSLFNEAAKIKNYDEAKKHFSDLRTNCPSVGVALYQQGEKLLNADLKKATSTTEKQTIANDLIQLLKDREQYFPAKTKDGQFQAKIAQILVNQEIGTLKSQYQAFKNAWQDKATIKQPKNIYTYFKLAVDSYKANELPLQEVFDLYDDVQAKMKEESNKLASGLTSLLKKQENGEQLSSKEKKNLKRYETNLKAFSIFSTNTDVYLGELADCTNLIPLYNKDFENKKNDVEWIKKAASRMSGKDCTDDPLFIKMVEQLDRLEPSPSTKQYLAILEKKKGNIEQAMAYWEEAANAIPDANKKAGLFYRIAEEHRKKGSYGKARTYYNKSLEFDPGRGRAYLRIAEMYAKSANNCGDSNFDKRAVYWLAANVANKAARVNPSLSKTAVAAAANYRGRAPSKSEIFQAGRAGETIRIGCWIQRSVKVPSF